jgi:DNA modification methylase
VTPHYYILPVDCRVAMRDFMSPQSVHTVVTSPPYFGLRDYGTDGQLGLEPTPDDFVAALVEVFREIKRVLRDDGTVWLNLGDSYATDPKGPNAWKSSNLAGGGEYQRDTAERHIIGKYDYRSDGLKKKDLIGIPWRVAFALQADGWYLRQDIIWEKPNPMPESVRDRCTKAHEYIFMLTKRPKYYFDSEAIKEPCVSTDARKFTDKSADKQRGHGRRHAGFNGRYADKVAAEGAPAVRNKRSVWRVSTKPFKGAHFATFPLDLIEPCILAGCPEQCCARCGAPVLAVYERPSPQPVVEGSDLDRYGTEDHGVHRKVGGEYQKWLDANPKQITGHKPTCTCDSGVTAGTVFDPFGGAGTTAVAALKHGRNTILSEINQEYIAMAHARIGASIK